MIPPYKYYFPEKTIDWISDTISELLKSDSYLTMGKFCEKFEEEYAKKTNTKYAVTVSSGIAALEVALRSNDITNGEVVLPTNTFGATALAVVNSGGTPVYCDISTDMNIDISDIKKRITSKTKAILPVHIGGIISSNIEEIRDYCKSNNLFLIEDAAHAHGSMFDKLAAGSIGDAGCFSFFPTKVMTTGEGGMMVTSNLESYEKAKNIRNYNKINGSELTPLGYNWRMSEFQAVVGLSQLMILDEILQKRIKAAKTYDDLLNSNEIFHSLEFNEKCIPSYYKYITLVPKGKNIDQFQKILKEKYEVTLGGFVYDIPLHRQKMFGKYASDKNSFPVADDLCPRHICLPIYPQITQNEIQYVIDSINSAAKDLGWNP